VKKFFARFKSLPLKTRQLLILGTTLALVVALPLFIWAILTQRFELRERAATGEPTPTPAGTSVNWQTPYAYFRADNFRIVANGKTFYANVSSPINVHSDPGSPTYTTLEVIWQENGVEMRLFIYFNSDGQKWWSPEIRIYDGKTPSNWITFKGKVFESNLGSEYTQTIPGGFVQMDPSTGKEIASVHFSNLRVQAFTSLTPVTPTPTPSAFYQKLKFKLKFAGVDDDSADGAKIRIRFLRGASGFDRQTPPVEVTHVGDGVYETVVSLAGSSLQIPVNDGYTIFIKGEKHLARRFCSHNQKTRCTGNGFFYIGATSIPSIQTFDLTGLPLEPGDLPPQDGKADSADFAKITSLFTKLCSALTEEEKKTADLDYNGCVNIRDAFLMRKTLEVKFDEY